jgi:hypothetical protein
VRTSVVSGSAVICYSADEFIRAVEVFNEAGRAEPRDDGGLEIEGFEGNPVRSFFLLRFIFRTTS